MANDDILRRDGVLARITGFDEGRTAYYAVMPNGHSTQLTFPSQEIFDIGDVLLVGKDFYTKVPPSVWPVKPRVGVIRRALEDCVVIETSDGLELLEGEYPVDIAPGNTVEFTDLFGIERVLYALLSMMAQGTLPLGVYIGIGHQAVPPHAERRSVAHVRGVRWV